MSRKILSLIVAVAFVLTTISTAFAATLPSDVTGDNAQAVSKVQSLNIMVGDAGTGLFRPNDTIKRSEFAVIAVKAMGLNDSAIISKGATKFSDVAADNWASGYINVAVGAGLISGYPDGTYKPDNSINYAEAITILGNMLGYGPVLAGKPWPGAYVAQANTSGITSGVVMAPTVGASRGNVAKLVSNTLDANIVAITGYDSDNKPVYSVKDADTKTLMAAKLSVTQVKGAAGTSGHTVDAKEFRVTGTPSVQAGATVGNSTLTDTDNGNTVKSLAFVDGLNANDYLGLNINAWTNTDNKVIVAQITNSTSDIYDGIVSKDGTSLKLDGKSASYGVASGFVGYLNGTNAAFSVIVNSLVNEKAQGRVVLSNGLVKFASVWATTPALGGQTVDAFTVKEVADGYIRAIGGTPSDIKVQDIKDNATKQLNVYSITKNGKVATIDDVKANDVVLRVTNGSHVTYVITENEVKGTLNSVSGNDMGMTLTIGTTAYSIDGNNVFSNTGTMSDGTPINAGNVVAQIPQYIGKAVTVELNAVGQIAALNCTATASTYYYGIVKSYAQNVGANLDNAVSLYKADGTKVSYLFDNNADVASAGWSTTSASIASSATVNRTIAQGALVQYQLTSDGKIKKQSLQLPSAGLVGNTDVTSTSSGVNGITTPANTAIYIDGGATGGVVSSSTVIFSVYDLLYNNGDVAVVPFSAIDGKGLKAAYQILTGSGLVKYIRVDGIYNAGYGTPGVNALSAGTSGVVANTGFDGDGKTVTINVGGTTKTYKDNTGYSAATWAADFAAGQFVAFKVDTSGKITGIDANVTNTTVSTIGAANVSTFNISSTAQAAIFRVIAVDSANKLLKLNHLKVDGTYAQDGTDIYFRYDPANLSVYDATDKANNNIVGGKDMSFIKQYDYVWLGGSKGTAYDFSQVVKLKVDDILTTNVNTGVSAH